MQQSMYNLFDVAVLSNMTDSVLTSYSAVLECILRLRQAANAPELIPPARLEAARAVMERITSRSRAVAAGAKDKGGDAVKPFTPKEINELMMAMVCGMERFGRGKGVERDRRHLTPRAPVLCGALPQCAVPVCLSCSSRRAR